MALTFVGLLGSLLTACLLAILQNCSTQIIGDDSCKPVWEFYNNSHSIGAKRLTQYTSLEACMDACADVITNCVAIDVNYANVIECWVHTTVDPLGTKYWWPTVLQAVLMTRCPTSGCGQTSWRLYANQNSFWGSLQSTSLLTADICLTRCAQSSSCRAVDFDYGVTVTSSNCYHHSAADFADSRGHYPGTDQYVVERCRNDTGRMCTFGWQLTLDVADYGAARYPAAKSLEDCREACFRNSSCSAYDYWPFGPNYCWLATPNTTEPLTQDPGNFHFDLVKRCMLN